MRIVSLLPSITEIIVSLGMEDQLVGRSHECNYPESVQSLPVCSRPKFKAEGNSEQIDDRLKELLREGISIYRVDEEKLAELDPDIILTQDHCEVCAASFGEVKKAAQSRLGDDVKVISVAPVDIYSVLESIKKIGEAVGAKHEAEELTQRMESQMKSIQNKVEQLYFPEVLCIEWLDPLMSAGNWMPQIVQLAGGFPLEATAGEHSPELKWRTLRRVDPDIITISPCGYSISQTLDEIDTLTKHPSWNELTAVKNEEVFIMDGDHYFNRPGPRLVDSTKILAEIIHPSLFCKGKNNEAWINLDEYQFQQYINF